MLNETLEKTIKDYISKEIIPDLDIQLNAESNLNEIGIQSIEIMELVFFIEKTFNCKLPAEFVYQKNINSIRSMVTFLEAFFKEKQVIIS